MRSVILFRHAEAEWIGKTGSDHDRVLSPNGIKDAEKMGIYISKKNNIPELVISSTAIRAKTTAEVAIKSGKWGSPFQLEAGIYGGNPEFLLKLAKRQEEKVISVCFVGHEPNFSSFIAHATNNTYKNFPTASIAKIDFDVKSWEDVVFGFGILDFLVYPQELFITP